MARQVLALAPDGSKLVFVANQRLYVRSMSDLEPRVIQGSDLGASVLSPTFSPVAHRKYSSPSTASRWCRRQQILPNGRALLFSIKGRDETWDKGQVAVQSLEDRTRKTLVDGGADGRYLSTGHIVYALSGILFAVPFDLDTLTVIGGSVPIVEGVRRAGLVPQGTATAQFDYSATGTLIYWPGPVTLDTAGNDLALFDRKGGFQAFKLPPRQYRSPRVSPDGRFVAFDSEDEKGAIVWVYELNGSTAIRQLTFGGKNRAPIWSHDGAWILFQSDREGDLGIFRQRADGSSTAERLTKAEADTAHWPQSFTPNGALLLYSVTKGDPRNATLWTMAMADRRPQMLSDLRAREASLSPDGKWLAYSNDDGIFVEPFPRTGAKYLVPERGGHPYWSPKGDQLFVNSAQTVTSMVPITTTPRLSFGRPQTLSRPGRSEPNPAIGRRNVDMLPDGQHIVGVTLLSGSLQKTDAPMIVVLNWLEELKQRVPTR